MNISKLDKKKKTKLYKILNWNKFLLSSDRKEWKKIMISIKERKNERKFLQIQM